jgi:hypothetical protein
VTETTTPTNVYADADLATPLSNPVVADAAGEFVPIYLDPSVTYRAILYDQFDVEQWDVDPLAPPRDYPVGTVAMFFGDATARDAAYPTALWQVCDGTNGSPDLRDRVPMGCSGSLAPGDTGGGSGVTNTSAAGAHDHGGAVSAVALDSTQMPVHGHNLLDRGAGSGIADGTALVNCQSLAGIRNVAEGAYITDNSLGSEFVEPTGEASPATHDHDIAEDGEHTHTVDTTPPFLALWFLYRKA